MTVFNSVDSKFGGTIRHIIFRWKGSVFKLVWLDLAIFLLLYSILSIIYRFILDPDQQRLFEKIAVYCEKYGTRIPVSFLLGFYVSFVINRWWAQYLMIPYIDTLAIWVNVSIPGLEDDRRLLRRTICRYVCLSITQMFALISSPTKKRFPTLDHLITAGLLLPHEKPILENVVDSIPKYQTHWVPLVWASTLVAQARKDGKIASDMSAKAITDEINKLKDQCNQLLSYDRIRVPLVYTQVATFAVYSYFFSCLMARQWIHHGQSAKISGKFGVEELDLVVPVFTILQFLFYIGWLQVAESLVNPFGYDDYDFELNWIVDRHVQVAYSIVDKMHFNTPDLLKDAYWDEKVPSELPHTLASLKFNNDPPKSSTASLKISREEGEILSPTARLSFRSAAKKNFRLQDVGPHTEIEAEKLENLGLV